MTDEEIIDERLDAVDPELTGIAKARAVRDLNRKRLLAGLPPLESARSHGGKSHRAKSPVVRAPAPRASAVPVTETPEFQAAVAQATAAALASAIPEIIGQLQEARSRLGETGSDQPGDRFWAEKLASQIALVNDPTKPVLSPEETASRAEGKERLLELLVTARAAGSRPVYTLASKVVLDIPGQGSTLIEPLQRGADNRVRPARIIHWDIPNEAMRPANEPAAQIHDAFLQWIGGRVAGGAVKLSDGTEFPVPPNGGYIETNYSLTNQGNAVVGLSAAQVGSIGHRERQSNARYGGILLDENDDPASLNNSGPPYVDVAVLGTIAPPARQNG